MMGFGFLAMAAILYALWRQRKGSFPQSVWFKRSMLALPFLPLFANSFGWIFTETARQPWVVFGLIKTSDGVSQAVSTGEVAFTMTIFTLLYGVLAVIEFGLIRKVIQNGPQVELDYEDPRLGGDTQKPLVAAY